MNARTFDHAVRFWTSLQWFRAVPSTPETNTRTAEAKSSLRRLARRTPSPR